MLDTARRIETPEGIELTLRLAGPVPRALAWSLDLLVRVAILIGVATLAGLLGTFGWSLVFLTAFALEWLYPVVWEVKRDGATPGKRALGLRVLRDDGTPVDWAAALTRNLLRAIDFLPFVYGFGLAAMLASRDFKRLGDLAANTLVVYRADEARGYPIPDATPLASAMVLTAAEQRSVLEFAERLPSLTPERAVELAELTGPLVEGVKGPPARERLVAIASHLLGRP